MRIDAAIRGGNVASAPNHMGVYSYDDDTGVSYVGGVNAPAATVRQWVDLAEGLPGTSKPITDAAGTGTPRSLVYFDVNKIYVNSDGTFRGDSIPMINAGLPETAWLHIPGTSATVASRLKGAVRGDGSYNLYVNHSDASARAWLVQYAQTNYSSFDGFFLDDWAYGLGGAGGLLEGVQGGYTTALEYASESAMRTAMTGFLAALKRADNSTWTCVCNSLSFNFFKPSGLGWLGTAGVAGLVAEQVPFNNTLDIATFPDHFIGTSYYPYLLDQLAYVVTQNHGFVVFMSNVDQIAQRRRLSIATQLLAYKDDLVYLWADNGSLTLPVYPEQGLWPDTTTAVQTMGAPMGVTMTGTPNGSATAGGHNDLQVTTGVFLREFATAHNQGTPIGKLCAIVNQTGSAVTVPQAWLTQTYGHSVTFTGDEVELGGTINVSGATFTAGSTTIPARDALILTA